MIKENSKVFWRSRHGNDINGFYKQISDGFHKTDKWNIFWIGVKNSDEIIECINYADSKEYRYLMNKKILNSNIWWKGFCWQRNYFIIKPS